VFVAHCSCSGGNEHCILNYFSFYAAFSVRIKSSCLTRLISENSTGSGPVIGEATILYVLFCHQKRFLYNVDFGTHLKRRDIHLSSLVIGRLVQDLQLTRTELDAAWERAR